MKSKLNICKETRKIAADSLDIVLKKVLKENKKISEVEFRNRWLKELRRHKELFPDGWYIPPHHGIGILFSTEDDVKRVSYKSLRPVENWPKESVFLDRNKGIAYLFVSPVNKEAGIIGDFGVTIYFGKNEKVINHLTRCYQLTKKIFDYARVGMKFADIAKYSSELYQENNVINIVESSTDIIGTNIGHTIPSTDKNWAIQEKKIFKNVSWEKTCKLISNRRIFLNESEKTILTNGMAITIEPRPRSAVDSSIPMVSFHTIGLFRKDGKKEWLTNFDKIFKLVGMNYMLE